MKIQVFILSVAVFSCLLPPAFATGLLAAKVLAASAVKKAAVVGLGAAKVAAAVGIGALAVKGAAGLVPGGLALAKGAALKGAGLLATKGVTALATKGALLKSAAGLAAKGALIGGGAYLGVKAVNAGINYAHSIKPWFYHSPSYVRYVPVKVSGVKHETAVATAHSILADRLFGLWDIAHKSLVLKASAVRNAVDTIKTAYAPKTVVYEAVETPVVEDFIFKK